MAVKGSQRQAQLLHNFTSSGESLGAIEARGPDLSNEVGFARRLGQHSGTHLLTYFGCDRIGVWTSPFQDVGVEMPFQPVRVEVDRTVEQSLIVAPVDRWGKRKDHPHRRKRRLEHATNQRRHGAAPEFGDKWQEIAERVDAVTAQDRRLSL